MNAESYIKSGILELYVAGVLSPEEMREVEQAAAQDASIKAEITAIEEGLKKYATLEAPQPGEDLKDRLMARIKNTAQNTPAEDAKAKDAANKLAKKAENPVGVSQMVQPKLSAVQEAPQQGRVSSPNFDSNPKIGQDTTTTTNNNNTKSRGMGYYFYVAASVIVIIVSAGMNIYLYQQWKSSQNELAEQRGENTRMANEFSTAKARLTDAGNQLAIYANPNNIVVKLSGMDAAPRANGMVYWNNTDKKVYIKMTGLPIAPQGKQYQLWAISPDDQKLDVGMMTDNHPKDELAPMKTVKAAKAFAITLEPMGGSPQPTSAIYAVGEVKS